jgi:hypothetical protein
MEYADDRQYEDDPDDFIGSTEYLPTALEPQSMAQKIYMPLLIAKNQILAAVDTLATKSFMSEGSARSLNLKTLPAPAGSKVILASGESTSAVLLTEPLLLEWLSIHGQRQSRTHQFLVSSLTDT